MRKAGLVLIVVIVALVLTINQAVADSGWTNINGSVTYNGGPVCSMVLANGQYMFTCSGDGSFDLNVPLDGNGQITVYSFCSGLSPFKKVITPSEGIGLNIRLGSADPGDGMTVLYTINPLGNNRVRLDGNIYFKGSPVCAMALANGQYMFSSATDGSFSLDLPLDGNGGITFYAFCSGLPPYKDSIPSYSLDQFEDADMDGFTIFGGDCNDHDANIHPWVTEICGDGVDQDCDGYDLACGTSPSITDVRFYRIVNGIPIESSVFYIGEQVTYDVCYYDPDRDIVHTMFEEFIPSDRSTPSSTLKANSPTQSSSTGCLSPIEPFTVYGPPGDVRMEIYLVDSQGNQSERWRIFFVIH